MGAKLKYKIDFVIGGSMNSDGSGVIDLEKMIVAGENRPGVILIGRGLFKVLHQAGRVGLRRGVFGFPHFYLDGEISIGIDRWLGEYDFRLSCLS